MINTYVLSIKSHNEYPDYEDITTADDLDEAVYNFLKQMPKEMAADWNGEFLKKYIQKYD
jgi:hypothetical protein